MKAIENLIINNRREQALINIWRGMELPDVVTVYSEPTANLKRDLKGFVKRLHKKDYLKKDQFDFIQNAFNVYPFIDAIRLCEHIIRGGIKRMRKAGDNVFYDQGNYKF